MMPLITTVIPTYRRPKLLRRAILSVLQQQVPEVKVCVYDNASGDETAEVVSELAAKDSRIEYHCHAKNIGGVGNFMFGMERVNTPFFSFLSDDDYLLPGFYQRALVAMDACPRAMCWAGMTLNVDEDGVIWDARVRKWAREGIFEPPEGFLRMTGGMAPTWTGVLFRRAVIETIGMIDPSLLGPADLEYQLRLAAKFPYILEKHPSAVFTLSRTSFSATQPMSSFWPGWKRMLQKFEERSDLDAVVVQEMMTALHRDAQRMLFRRGANALATGRMDFVRDAADALQVDCGVVGRAHFLRTLAAVCEHSGQAQQAYAWAYRSVERRMVESRSELQAAYGGLLIPA